MSAFGRGKWEDRMAEQASKDFVMSRVFDVPRDLLWKCFTDPERMKQWWGPKGFTVIASKMDLRVGGTYHYGMNAPDGSPMWGLFRYREIVPQERLVFVNSFSDEKGGVTRHPAAPTWPLKMLSTFTFEDAPSSKTKFTVTSMKNGWTGTMEQLEAYLAKAK